MDLIEKKNNQKQKLSLDNQWIVLLNLHEDVNPLNWFISEKEGEKIIAKSRKLPLFRNGIPEIISEKLIILKTINSIDTVIYCCNGVVVILEKNIFEFRYDSDFTIENEIYKSILDNTCKENILNITS